MCLRTEEMMIQVTGAMACARMSTNAHRCDGHCDP
jgi:hypothetical protein